MFYLYKKTHRDTGVQYLGYTKKDPYQYKGSGTYWLRHIATHGNNVETEIIAECVNKEHVKEVGQYYSTLWDVVQSDRWANLKAEEADGGDMRGSQAWVDGRTKPEFRRKQADSARGNTNVRGRFWWQHLQTGERRRCADSPGREWVRRGVAPSDDQRRRVSESLTGRVKSNEHKQKLSAAAKGRVSNNKGTIWVKNTNGDRRRVDPSNIPFGFQRV